MSPLYVIWHLLSSLALVQSAMKDIKENQTQNLPSSQTNPREQQAQAFKRLPPHTCLAGEDSHQEDRQLWGPAWRETWEGLRIEPQLPLAFGQPPVLGTGSPQNGRKGTWTPGAGMQMWRGQLTLAEGSISLNRTGADSRKAWDSGGTSHPKWTPVF